MGFSFFPKEDKFYKLMEALSSEVYNSTICFKEFIESKNPSDMQTAVAKIQTIRSQSKVTSSKITEELCRSFITPFDREDIQDITNILYKIPKIIEKVSERITMHGMGVEGGDFSYQAELIVQEATAMRTLLNALIAGKGSKDVLESVDLLKDLEQKGDKVRNELIVALFKSDRDIREIILRRDIYDMLEKVVDRFRDVASVALQIVLKHS